MSSEKVPVTVTTILGVPERLRALEEGFVGTQTTFLRGVGVRLSQWRRYTRGERLPEDAVLRRIAQAMNVSVRWLLTGSAERLDPLRSPIAPHRCDFLDFVAICARRKFTRRMIVAAADEDEDDSEHGSDWAEETMTRATRLRDGQRK